MLRQMAGVHCDTTMLDAATRQLSSRNYASHNTQLSQQSCKVGHPKQATLAVLLSHKLLLHKESAQMHTPRPKAELNCM